MRTLWSGVIAAVAVGALCVSWPAGVWAQSGEPTPEYDATEAQAIDRMLMCPVCPAENIDQAQVPLARQMRAQVRELLADGATRQEVLEWFKERYGPGIVAEPPRSGFNLIAWLTPAVVVPMALVGGILALRAMRRRQGEPETAALSADATSDATGELHPYLAAVDRELSLPVNPGQSEGDNAEARADAERNDG